MKSFFLIVFFSSFINLKSQVGLINNSLKDSTLRILYVGDENEIEITGTKKGKKYSLKSKNNKVFYNENLNNNTKYSIECKSEGIDTLSVFEDKKQILEVSYEIHKKNLERCILGNYISSYLTKKQIIESPYISLHIPNCFLKVKAIIYSFELSKIVQNKTIPLYENLSDNEKNRYEKNRNQGSYFTDYQIKQISEMKKGDKLIIDNLKIFAPCLRKIPGLIITIK
jgi:hypothetical protein